METTPSPQSRLPDFIALHNGTQREIPPAEQVVVAQKFTSLIEDLLLTFAEHVEHDTIDIPQDTLALRLPVNETDHWTIKVESLTVPHPEDDPFLPAERVVKGLFLQYEENGIGKEGVGYTLGTDSVVRRYDVNVATESSDQSELEDSEGQTLSEDMEDLENYQIPNERLAERMGYQRQPIGLSEVDGLTDFVTQPEVVVAPPPFS